MSKLAKKSWQAKTDWISAGERVCGPGFAKAADHITLVSWMYITLVTKGGPYTSTISIHTIHKGQKEDHILFWSQRLMLVVTSEYVKVATSEAKLISRYLILLVGLV